MKAYWAAKRKKQAKGYPGRERSVGGPRDASSTPTLNGAGLKGALRCATGGLRRGSEEWLFGGELLHDRQCFFHVLIGRKLVFL